jgi:phosphoserine phosphatase RsbU/P
MRGVPSSSKRQRPLAHYVALAVLFIMAIAYEVFYTKHQFPAWFIHPDAVRWPFLVGAVSDDMAIDFLTPEAKGAGLRAGETLVAVNGKRATGTAVYGEIIAHASAGDRLEVTVRPQGEPASAQRTISLRLEGRGPPHRPVVVTLLLVMPALCLLLGFWVAAVRPRDPLAWLLLALMLGFPAIFQPFAESWGPSVRDFGVIFHVLFGRLLVFWMLLFGIYFPEPFPADARWRWWDWCKWAFGVPLVLDVVVGVVLSLGLMEDYSTVRSLGEAWHYTEKPIDVCSYAAMGTFFACLLAKSRMTISRDAKRRLRLMYSGAFVAFTPLLILEIVGPIVHHTPVEQYFPPWVFLTAYALVFLFPVTLAYVIVVHKAMDVRMVIRQGLQYALARGALLSLMPMLAVILVIDLLLHRDQPLVAIMHGRGWIYLGLGGCALAAQAMRQKWLEALDRRFFREAYDA